jgi:hypothetical protein
MSENKDKKFSKKGLTTAEKYGIMTVQSKGNGLNTLSYLNYE